MDKNYILITPARNEENYISYVIKAVLEQTLKPALWVIVDDGSTDNTSIIIDSFIKSQHWIKSIRLPPHPRDINQHYAYVCRMGFDYAILYCKTNNIAYEFIGLLDADTVLEREYFKLLIEEFDQDPHLGLASGGIYYHKNGKLELEKGLVNSPRGTGRLWKNSCFFSTGGYLVCPAPPDTISNVKANLRGYSTRQFVAIVAIQKRRTSSMGGIWNSNFLRGKSWHYLNAHPSLIVLNCFYLSIQHPYYGGIAFLCGYLISVFKREQIIEDIEIKEYFFHRRVKDILNHLLGRSLN